MLNKNIGSRANVYIIMLLMFMLLVPSCRESSEDPDEGTGGEAGQVQSVSDSGAENLSKPTAGNVPLPIRLPNRRYEGTPQDIRGVSNLEKPLGHDRPPFYAPKGTENVALGKPVTSSDEAPLIGDLEMLTDGDSEATDFSYVELGPLRQHVTIDLGGEYNIYAVLFWHYHKQPRVYFDVVVQVADDPDFITNVRTLFNNDIDNSSGLGVGGDMHYVDTHEGKLIGVEGGESIRARYVRLYSKGSSADDANHYIEVEVYGKAAK